jgi:hypothetical protein
MREPSWSRTGTAWRWRFRSARRAPMYRICDGCGVSERSLGAGLDVHDVEVIVERVGKRAVALLIILIAPASTAWADIVTASWDRNPEPDVTGYILSYGLVAGGP